MARHCPNRPKEAAALAAEEPSGDGSGDDEVAAVTFAPARAEHWDEGPDSDDEVAAYCTVELGDDFDSSEVEAEGDELAGGFQHQTCT